MTKARKDVAKDTVDKLGDIAEGDDAELDAVMADYWSGLETHHRAYITQRFELKKNVTREEWEAIFAAPPDED